MKTDKEMMDWLSMRCFFPNDFPSDDLVVIVPERFSRNGSFTINPENDRRVFRKAVQKAMDFYTK